jgi:hypothetical protein
MRQYVSAVFECDEFQLFRKLRETLRYVRVRERSRKSIGCCVQRNLFRLGDIGEIDRSQCVTEKIKAESKTFKNRYAAYEEDVNAALQLISSVLRQCRLCAKTHPRYQAER